MKKYYLNLIIMIGLLSLLVFNKKQHVAFIQEQELYSSARKNITMYHGPSANSKKAYVILKEGYPLYVLAKKKGWVKIIDYENKMGWIHKSNLSKEKRAISVNKIALQNEETIILPGVSLKIEEEREFDIIVKINNNLVKISKQDVWLGPTNIQKKTNNTKF